MQKDQPSYKVVLAAIAVVLVFEFFSVIVLNEMVYHRLLLVLGFIRIVEISLLIAIIAAWGGGLASIGLTRDSVAIGVRKGLIWSAGFGICALLLLGVLFVFDYNLLHIFQSPVQGSALGFISLLVVGGLISPVAEEIFFRGILYGYLRKWGVIFAVIGSTALFAMAHLLTLGVTPVQIIGGLVFAIAYEIEKNLLVPIIIHVLGNMALFTLSTLQIP